MRRLAWTFATRICYNGHFSHDEAQIFYGEMETVIIVELSLSTAP